MKLKNGDAVIIYNDKEVNKRILLGKVMKSVNEHDEILPESSRLHLLITKFRYMKLIWHHPIIICG